MSLGLIADLKVLPEGELVDCVSHVRVLGLGRGTVRRHVEVAWHLKVTRSTMGG